MTYYDYEQVPLSVADEAFADFSQSRASKSILDLLADLIRHCDTWCDENGAFSDHDQRVAAIQKLQSYLHETYATELSQLMQLNINKYRQRQEITARLNERRN